MNHHPSSEPTRRPTVRRALVAGLAVLGVAAGGVALAGGSAGAIVAGNETPVTEAPWQVSLQDDTGHFCGGSVIDDRVVLTAAHCVEGTAAADITVRAGVTDRDDTGGQDVRVARVIEHPAGFEGSADVALLVLESSLRTGDAVQTIGLATADDVAAATTGTVSGWGALGEDDENGSETLLSAEVPMLDDTQCSRDLAEYGESIEAHNEVCAEGDGAGSCYGDSGGPLVVTGRDGEPKLAGIVSWGAECATSPGVFAEVPAFAQWIEQGVAAGRAGDEHPGGEGTATDDDTAVPEWDEFDDADWDDTDFDDTDFDDTDWDDTDWDDTDWDDTDFDDTDFDDTDFDDTDFDDADWDDTDLDDTDFDDTDWDDTDFDELDWDGEFEWCDADQFDDA